MMITFDEGNFRFNYRVAGVALNNDHVLMHMGEDEDFWSLPGGRGELLEPARQTLLREMQEEVGIDVEVVRLLWIVENFFQHDNKDYHEIAFYFLMELPEGSPFSTQEEFTVYDFGKRLDFKWQPLDGLESLRLYPSFLRTALKDLPDTVEHIVHTDEP